MGNYLDLKEKVWETGRCSGCGGCTAICPADALYFDNNETEVRPTTTGYCKEVSDGVPCGACYEVCPRLSGEETKEGEIFEILAAKAGFEVEKKQSGGAVSAILVNGIEEGLLDAVVTVEENPWTLKPSSVVLTSSEALIYRAGSRYSWWVPLLSALKEAVVTKGYRKIAIVGLPCVVEAVERIRTSEHELLKPYGKSISLVIGLFCTESFSYDKLMDTKIKKERNIEPWQIRRMDVKGALELVLQDGKEVIPIEELDDCILRGCHHCDDFAAERADISAGSIGSPENHTTLIIRNPVGERFVSSAKNSGKLLTSDDVERSIIEKMASRKKERLHEK
ncbi:coenzyme F420 hydrogenase subunit beta [Methanohalophilus levihalophilus]|uniref:Coenzyme F420 hydrogenase/dehydrogenase, beta subunit C-terminal domain n=1 Tax=Methanohalophilus levihalophilus TaxID=1431282 RepID=UPI001AE0EB1A|nr:Coenzyme F420 hydrogenase/dehydrogenase, beta subunit C-terminal domain [Methanohalophilus levihalophilus]MBP2030738.1 coenzyme F420 hydrogenase subunit beta [Methanohalophilus levihalophilus]